MPEAIAVNTMYKRAEKEWRQGRVRSAFRLYLAAAEVGVVSAFRIVGQFYDCGTGVRANEAKALYWYRRAYRQGDRSAANNIGCIWRDRNKLSRAIRWFHRAVELGDDDANLNLAKICLRNGGDLRKTNHYLNKVWRSRHVTQGSRVEAMQLLRKIKTKRTIRVGR